MTTRTIEDLPPAFEDIVHISTTRTLSFLLEPNDLASTTDNVVQGSSRDAVTLSNATGEDEDAEEEEQLPGYEEEVTLAQLPDYAERHLLEPVVSYNVYQINRGLQVLTPATRATFERPRYRVTARLRPSMFSKRADYTLTRLPTGITAATENSPGADVGFSNFDRAGQLPWMPRATVSIMVGSSSSAKKVAYDLCAPNFADWKFTYNGQMYYWKLTDRPTSLSLMEHSSNSIIARFTYSAHGTDATRGAEVGTLSVFGGYGSGSTEAIELVLSTWVVPLNHWKNMGRHYRNNVTPRNASVVGPITLGNSFFAGDGRSSEPRRVSNAV